MKPNVHLHIDRLVLDGFEHLDRTDLGIAVEAELTRLFGEQGASQTLMHDARVPRLDGGQFNVAQDAGSEAVGTQVAQSIYGGLNR